jgi:hypothetical protein
MSAFGSPCGCSERQRPTKGRYRPRMDWHGDVRADKAGSLEQAHTSPVGGDGCAKENVEGIIAEVVCSRSIHTGARNDRKFWRPRGERANVPCLGAHGDSHHGLWLSRREIRSVPGACRPVPGRPSSVTAEPEIRQPTGLALIVLGTAMVALSAIRFVKTAKNIDAKEVVSGTGSRSDLALAALLVLLGCSLFFYMSHAFVTAL